MKRAIAWIGVWIVCLIVAVWALLAIAASAAFGSGRRAWAIVQAKDQLGNVLIGGDQDEWISARAWRLRAQPRWARAQRAIDWLAFHLAGEVDHCKRAFEAEQARRERPYLDGTSSA